MVFLNYIKIKTLQDKLIYTQVRNLENMRGISMEITEKSLGNT